MPAFTYAPPTPSPGEGSPSPTVTTTEVTPSMTQLPVTGPGDNVAEGALLIGLPTVILGAVLIAIVMRLRRHRTE